MSMESCSSRFTADAKELERYLELTRNCMERVQSMTLAPCGSTTPKFNSEQCDYLVGKLRLAVESAHFFLELLDGGNVWFPSAEAFAICLENFKLLYTMSGEVESFTRECCRDDWIHAALRLTHVSEHVSSMGFNLQLWSIFVSFVSPRSLTLQEVDSVYSSEVETVKAKASIDKNTLSARLNVVLCVTKTSSSKHNLAAFVLDRLDSTLNSAGELAGSSQASFSREVLQSLKKQKKSLLGKGGSAHVYSLTWSGAEFAVKTFFGKDNANFDKEVSVLRNLFHPNIVSVLCYVKEMGKCSIIMERMDEDLHSFMQARCGENRPPFGIMEGVDIMLQIGGGMHYLHGLRTAHRDLKSANILLRIVQAPELELEYVMVKVADFGLSKRDLRSMTDSLLTCNTGTARWMAPELIKVSDAENETLVVEGEALVKNFPFKCDIYSFAIVCCEILTGEHPFADIVTSNEVKRLVLRGTRPRLPAGCPNELKDLIERCWSPNAETRPNFGEICAELRHLKYLLTSSAVTADYSLLASSSFASFRRGFQLSHPASLQFHDLDHGKTAKIPQGGDRGEAQTILQSHDLDHDMTAEIPQEDRNVLQCGRPTNSAVSAAMAAGGSAPEFANVDYCQQSISSFDAVQMLVAEDPNLLQLNDQQCRYLARKLTETGLFLRAKSSLVKIRDSTDIRRMPLLHLHFAVKRAEKLVRGCCCERESWLEAAVTLSHVKETIKDILLDLRWWTSMVDIAITSVKGKSSGQTTRLLEILESAEEDFEKLLRELHTPNNGLVRAASEDKSELLGKVREVETWFAGGGRSAEQKHEYLLAVHVRSRLENSDAEAVEDLNEYEDAKLIGFGGFGVVQDVRWMGRRCALKILHRMGKEEATKLREFQHPHIVKFFRYFEAPFRQTPNGTPRDSSQGTPGSDSGPVYRGSSQSHILMELLPMDLSQYLGKLQDTASFTVGSKGKPEHTGGAPLPVDVALDVMLQTVKAMWHLNSKDVAHRDVKPSNLLVRPVSFDEVPELTARGYVWAELADLGLAKTEAFSSAYSTQPKKIGSKMYGAPEIFNEGIRSEKSYPLKADVWSFGIIFCEVLTGKPPFPGVVDGRMKSTVLQENIVKGLRPKLPENCPDYLKFIIESCWHLKPEDRPTFGDLWRLMRIAQAQSLGLVQKDHDLFFYRPRTGLKKFRSVVKRVTPPAPPSPGPLPISEGITPSGPSIWMLVTRWISSNLTRKRGLGFRPRSSSKRGNSKSREVSVSRAESECKPLGSLVNQLVPLDEDISASKLDVIFFEGNVGRRKGLSCKDTWVQRNNPDVWWPRDWLPKDLGDDIRVLVVEYCISDDEDGVDGVLDRLQRLLVFSERWNRRNTWERPIVLVGHSLGCVMIEHLVVALDRKAKLTDEVEIGRAKVAKAFLTNLAGCFFYAPPWTGLVRSDDLLTYVFGGLTYSEGLFADLCSDSPMLKSLSEVFVQVKPEHMKLTALIEGFHTKGRIVVPPGSMLGFDGTVVELEESNHIDVCKPTDKQHLAYKEVLRFIGEVLEDSKLSMSISS